MKIKLWISLVLAFLAFIFITQNTEAVNVRFLAWSAEMSLVLLVFIMLGAGVIIGWLLNSYIRYTGNRKRQPHRETGIVKETGKPHTDTRAFTFCISPKP